jgi:inhibitor of KinA sporulation pathway (predicted exonuclease)
MHFFIDFEATQYSEEIISVGCVREDGETFYSLVAPVSGKITPFITNLTGITSKMLETAMSPNNVFEMFYDWVFTSGEETPEFYCWGDSDINFIRNTFKKATSLKARLALGYMCGDIKDYSKEFSKKKGIGLLKVLRIFEPEATQNHNSLDDAVMLYKIYQNFSALPPKEQDKIKLGVAGEISPDKPKWFELDLADGAICIINKHKQALHVFTSIDKAVEWIFENKMIGDAKETADRKKVANKILKACRKNENYFEMHWVQVKKGG